MAGIADTLAFTVFVIVIVIVIVIVTGPVAIAVAVFFLCTYYPRPRESILDNKGELKAEFKELFANNGLKEKTSLFWNPQLHAIFIRIYQVVADYLKSLELEDWDINKEEGGPFEEYLSMISYAICSACNKTHGHSLRQIEYRRDMCTPTNVQIDWIAIKKQKCLF